MSVRQEIVQYFSVHITRIPRPVVSVKSNKCQTTLTKSLNMFEVSEDKRNSLKRSLKRCIMKYLLILFIALLFGNCTANIVNNPDSEVLESDSEELPDSEVLEPDFEELSHIEDLIDSENNEEADIFQDSDLDPDCEAIEETCENRGIDNDCDGDPEDVDLLNKECLTGASGICATGRLECVDTRLLCVAENEPGVESCDNQESDDNCDGVLDNILGLNSQCVAEFAFGVCRVGHKQCDGVILSCIPDIEPGSLAEDCNLADDDCDGEIDEGFDFSTEVSNCGDCFTECSEEQSCCVGYCASLGTDRSNCGECGLNCALNEECIGGFCYCGLGFCSLNETCTGGECCLHGKCSTPSITIPGGPFMMGCNGTLDNHCDSDEYPYHTVNVPTFEIDVTEVTLEQYTVCVDSNSCSEPGIGGGCSWEHSDWELHPINCIEWTQSKNYCEWVGKRLCSESEWEKAARGPDGRIHPWGNEVATCERTVMRSGSSNTTVGCGEGHSWPVASKPPGVYGLYDMSGNVWEWVEDDYHDDYNNAPDDGRPWIENPRASTRIYRGCSFYDSAHLQRVADRNDDPPGSRFGGIGFRCCNDIF